VRAALVAVVLGFVPGLLDPFNAPRAAVLRLIGLPLLAWVAVTGIGRDARSRGVADSSGSRVLDLAVLGWLAATIVSTIFGLSPRLSLIGEIQQREGLLTVLALGGLYFAARRSHRTVAQIQGTLRIVLAGAGLAAVYALLQRAGLDPVEWASTASYPVRGGSILRVFGSLGNAILLGAVLAAAFAIGLSGVMSSRRTSMWGVAVLILSGVATAATLSRSAYLALIAGTIVAGNPAKVLKKIPEDLNRGS
jgi:hypothetical protein